MSPLAPVPPSPQTPLNHPCAVACGEDRAHHHENIPSSVLRFVAVRDVVDRAAHLKLQPQKAQFLKIIITIKTNILKHRILGGTVLTSVFVVSLLRANVDHCHPPHSHRI